MVVYEVGFLRAYLRNYDLDVINLILIFRLKDFPSFHHIVFLFSNAFLQELCMRFFGFLFEVVFLSPVL